MKKKNLIDALELVEPALSTNNLVPIFSHFCFQSGQVYAFNDQIGIVATCDIDETFAVHGKSFLGLLKASTSDEIEITLKEDDALLKSGASEMRLPSLSEKGFIFEVPEPAMDEMMYAVKPMLEGIELCLPTASRDQTKLAFMGVFLDDGALYSCDGDVITKVTYEDKGFCSVKKLLPIPFCETLLKFNDKFDGIQLIEGWVIASLAKGGDVTLYGRLLDNYHPFDYEGLITKTLKSVPKYVPVPEGLNEALTRAWVVAEPDNAKTTLTVAKNNLTIVTETALGVVRDTLPFKHPDITANVSAGLIQRSLKTCDKMAIMENCTAFRKGEVVLQLIANMA